MNTTEKSGEAPVLKTVFTLFFAVLVGLLVSMAPKAHATPLYDANIKRTQDENKLAQLGNAYSTICYTKEAKTDKDIQEECALRKADLYAAAKQLEEDKAAIARLEKDANAAAKPAALQIGSTLTLNSPILGCTDLIDVADAKLEEQTGVRMHRLHRPADSPAPDCKYLRPGVQFTIDKVDDQLMGMSPAFLKLCVRETASSEACRWTIGRAN